MCLVLNSCRRETIVTRWPRILADTSDALFSPSAPSSELALSQRAEIKTLIDGLLQEIKSNKTPSKLEDDGGEHVEAYNRQVEVWEQEGKGWEQVPWLWSECYL